VAAGSRMPGWLGIAWPDVWHDEAQLEPQLIRARSGNYGLILVGSDQELEDAKLDAAPADSDLTAIAAPITMVRLLLLLRARSEAIAMRMQTTPIEPELEPSRHENDMLISLGRSLPHERHITPLPNLSS